MPADNDPTRLVLLRVLGVLLILVGFTIIARSAERPVDAAHTHGFQHIRAVVSDAMDGIDRCKRIRIDPPSVHVPKPPAPPRPPAARILN